MGIAHKFHFVYRITNKINGHYYIGVHSTTIIEDGYMGSGTLMKSALRKYGPENFSREIIGSFETRELAFSKEAELIGYQELNDCNCYNLVLGGKGIRSKPIYSKKAERLFTGPKLVIPFDKNFEYKVDLLHPVSIANPEVLTSFGRAFWNFIVSGNILELISRLYNDATSNDLANKYISLLERIPAFKNNIAIYRYDKSIIDKTKWQSV